ncbi:hypothetical protein ACIRRH_40695 [Kitasatospora sp. NPDC101235]|uniref:hypothetical protein n=1 Tax=Kitasatospora sp. NPDC101235 TaxID=3364101 RepID=UPI003801F599
MTAPLLAIIPEDGAGRWSWPITLLHGDDGGSSDAAYRLGYTTGPFLLAAILLGIGLALHAAARRRRSRTAGPWPQKYEQWQQIHQVWRTAWLCRRCRVTFLPGVSAHPDSPASPAIPVAQFPQWLASIAHQADSAASGRAGSN